MPRAGIGRITEEEHKVELVNMVGLIGSFSSSCECPNQSSWKEYEIQSYTQAI